MQKLEKVPIEKIVIGERWRKDFGDLKALWENIQAISLANPIILNSKYELVDGERRLRAYIQHKQTEIPALIEDDYDELEKLMQAQNDLNEFRKALTPSEAVIKNEYFLALKKREAKERQKESGKSFGRGKIGCEKFTQPIDKGKSRDQAGKLVGMSGVTYERARAVVNAAKAEPEKYGDLVENMDKTGKVNASYTALRARRDEAKLDNFDKRRESAAQESKYPTITITSLKHQQLLSLFDEMQTLLARPANQISPHKMRICFDKIKSIIWKGKSNV